MHSLFSVPDDGCHKASSPQDPAILEFAMMDCNLDLCSKVKPFIPEAASVRIFYHSHRKVSQDCAHIYTSALIRAHTVMINTDFQLYNGFLITTETKA